MVGLDVIALPLIVWLAYRLRLGASFVPTAGQWFSFFAAPLIAIPIFIRMGLYRAVIRYLPERTILVIGRAMILTTLGWVAVEFVLADLEPGVPIPRSVPLLFFVLGALVTATTRFAVKEFLAGGSSQATAQRRVLIYGADDAGAQLAMALAAAGEWTVAGFLDDDPSFQGRDIAGARVFPPIAIGDLVRNAGVSEVILSTSSLPAARRSEIYRTLSAHPVKIRLLPAITDLAAGKYRIGALREIDIDDLLGRSAVPPDPALLRQMLANKTVLVSGAGGSIGSELTRLIARWNPSRIVLFEANEFALYEIERRLAAESSMPLVPVLGSVTDEHLVRRVLASEKVEVVFHAAAHKHVPLLESNVLEGVRNNVFGTATLARAALDAGVGNFVLISTDKAVRPVSVMGATKRWAELIVDDCNAASAKSGLGARFCAVRFGNVLGSNGSVVPLFREQIARGGPVTLTDSRMTRYFMSVHEAAELIVQSGALSEGGDIFLLEMGEPIAIRDLAENMVRLAGFTVRSTNTPAGDIEIVEIGGRPGEKIEEELFFNPAEATRTSQPRILRAAHAGASGNEIAAALDELRLAHDAGDEAEVRRLLFAFVDSADRAA